MAVAFILKKPSPKDKRKAYSFLRRDPKPASPGKFDYTKIEDPRIDALNAALNAADADPSVVQRQAEHLRVTFYSEARRNRGEGERVFNSDNQRLFEKFWKAYPGSRRPLKDSQTAYHDYRRAVEAIGSLPLLTAPTREIQREINRNHRGDKQRRIIIRLRTVLRFFKREDANELILDHADNPEVKYLAGDDYAQIRLHLLHEHDRLFLDILYYSGMRVGEAFAVEPKHLSGNALKVMAQLDDQTMIIGPTKNKKTRTAFVHDAGIEALRGWWELPQAVRDQLRTRRWSDVVHRACRQAFPGDESRDLCAHDLRHCYAINLLNKGVGIAAIAKAIGDSVAVADKHYLGFSLKNEAIDMIASIVKRQ